MLNQVNNNKGLSSIPNLKNIMLEAINKVKPTWTSEEFIKVLDDGHHERLECLPE